MAELTFQALTALRRSHPAWRLLAAAHAPFIASFLHRVFIAPNLRTLSLQELCSRLDDDLLRIRKDLGPEAFPRASAEYLDEWASDAHGWLRKYYPADGDEPHFDLTAGTEKAIEWLGSLRQRQFVGTESRLLMVFDLLRQLVEGTDTDPRARIAELHKRRAQIDKEIARIEQGELALLDSTRIKDRFQQVVATARGLLADFREVEQNFRELDRGVREKIALWEGSKADLLARIFGESDAISDSDQGRSFRAFWDFLMSPARQQELTELLQKVFALDSVQALGPDRRILRVHYDWLDAGEVAQRTVARLSEQLRRYLDDQAWAEDRRVMQLIRQIEQRALAVRADPPKDGFATVDGLSPDLELPMDRPLFTPPLRPELRSGALEEGEAAMASDPLFEQFFVDRAALQANIRRALQARAQISLADLLAQFPLRKGLSELVAYLKIASDEPGTTIIDSDEVQHLEWVDAEGRRKRAAVPRIIFTRAAPGATS
jgi:hypothetical protein